MRVETLVAVVSVSFCASILMLSWLVSSVGQDVMHLQLRVHVLEARP